MNKIFTIILAFALLTPQLGFAVMCQDEGFSVIYINGIWTEENPADDDKDRLRDFINLYSTQSEKIDLHLAYNPTRGELDIVKSIMQSYQDRGNEKIDQDAKRMLAKLFDKVNHKRILLVGHSQGSFYTNALYTYLRENGINKSAIAVYNIGTPASYVAGDGTYITNSTDEVINTVRKWAKTGGAHQPLIANTHILLQDNQKDNAYRGHGIQRVYLAGEGKRIVAEIDSLLDALTVPSIALKEGGCYFEPQFSWKDTLAQGGINVGSITSTAIATPVTLVSNAIKATTNIFKVKPKKQNREEASQVKIVQKQEAPTQKITPKPSQQPKPQPKKALQVPKQATAIAPDYAEMQALLDQLQKMLEQYALTLQKPDKCAGKDVSILKYSTCVEPFEIGGYGYGAGGAGELICPEGSISFPKPDGSPGCAPDLSGGFPATKSTQASIGVVD